MAHSCGISQANRLALRLAQSIHAPLTAYSRSNIVNSHEHTASSPLLAPTPPTPILTGSEPSTRIPTPTDDFTLSPALLTPPPSTSPAGSQSPTCCECIICCRRRLRSIEISERIGRIESTISRLSRLGNRVPAVRLCANTGHIISQLSLLHEELRVDLELLRWDHEMGMGVDAVELEVVMDRFEHWIGEMEELELEMERQRLTHLVREEQGGGDEDAEWADDEASTAEKSDCGESDGETSSGWHHGQESEWHDEVWMQKMDTRHQALNRWYQGGY